MNATATGDMPQILTSVYGSSSSMFLAPATDFEFSSGAALRTYNPQPTEIEDMPANSQRRIVQVFIADADANVPLEHALLHKSEPKFTDATDQELYFDIPVAELLKAHNEKRKTWQDKDATRKAGKDVFLEPAKIRDLKMVVVNIAQF